MQSSTVHYDLNNCSELELSRQNSPDSQALVTPNQTTVTVGDRSVCITDQMKNTYSFLCTLNFNKLISDEAFGLYLNRRLVCTVPPTCQIYILTLLFR